MKLDVPADELKFKLREDSDLPEQPKHLPCCSLFCTTLHWKHVARRQRDGFTFRFDLKLGFFHLLQKVDWWEAYALEASRLVWTCPELANAPEDPCFSAYRKI
jgi:hypothetical protein